LFQLKSCLASSSRQSMAWADYLGPTIISGVLNTHTYAVSLRPINQSGLLNYPVLIVMTYRPLYSRYRDVYFYMCFPLMSYCNSAISVRISILLYIMCCITHYLIVPRAVIQDVSVFSASNNDVYLYIKRMAIVPKELHYEKSLSV